MAVARSGQVATYPRNFKKRKAFILPFSLLLSLSFPALLLSGRLCVCVCVCVRVFNQGLLLFNNLTAIYTLMLLTQLELVINRCFGVIDRSSVINHNNLTERNNLV